MNNLKEISKVIKKSKSVAIFTHISPDFDALGSSYTLCLALQKLGKKAKLFLSEELTSDQKKIYKNITFSTQLSEEEAKEFDTLILTDASAKNRLAQFENVFLSHENTIVLDHHICLDEIAKYNYIKTDMSACSEITYQLIKLMKIKVDKEMATYLYAGLSSDTGSFRNSNTNENSFKTAMELYKEGADSVFVNEVLYDQASLKDIEFQKYLFNNFKLEKDCAYCTVDLKTLKKLNGSKAECSSFSRTLISFENVNYSFSLVEENGVYNLSLRSKVGYNVKQVAEKLGGGGHVCAAGAKIKAESIELAKQLVLKEIFAIKKN